MAKNDFKPFATGEYANVLSQEDYETLDALNSGFTSGIARSEQLNKVWRQASTIAATVGSFMANKSGDDVLDDGNIAKLEATLVKALIAASRTGLDEIYLQKDKNLAEITNKNEARINIGLSKVGNYRAVQANGGKYSSGDHSYYMDWGTDGKLHITVDTTDVGEVFTSRNPPTAEQTGALSLTGGAVTGTITTKGQFIPTNYANFDARYQVKGEAYTKTESDGRYQAKGEAYTKTESDARYPLKSATVIGMRRGTEASMVLGNPNPAKMPAGCVMTGWYTEGQNPGGDTIYYRPLQVNINGSWVTITG